MNAVAAPLGTLVGPADEVYLRFEEMPFDELPEGYKDGDDSVLKDSAGPHELGDALLGTMKFTDTVEKVGRRRVVVPHPRDLKKGDYGLDVLQLQRALAAAKLRKWGNFTMAFGPGTLAELQTFQQKHKLRVDGIYGEATHLALAPYYDAHGIAMLLQYQANTAQARAEKAALAACMVAYNFRFENHYTQSALRWMMIANRIHHQQLGGWRATWSDCSSFFTWVFWDILAPDPNHLNFGGGYTGTIGLHGTRVDPERAPIGSAFLYGPGTHEHVQFGLGGWNTIGDGGEAGPLYLRGDYRGDLNVVRSFPLI